MTTEQYLVIALLAIGAVFLLRRFVAAAFVWKYHGPMLVTCPETCKPAAVRVGIFRSALHEFVNRGHIELCSCSRWPERRDCEQDCVREIEKAPENHRVWKIASQWFAGKTCVYCGKPIATLSHVDHVPALLRTADRTTVEWRDLSPQDLPEAFSQCAPVCWSCHMTETFLRKFPGRAVVRPWRH